MLKKTQSFYAKKKCGRMEVEARAIAMGRDLLVSLTGGEAHAGAAAIAGPDGNTRSLALPGHRDDAPASTAAGILAAELDCNVIVTAGIHYDNVTREEIAQIMEMCHILTAEILSFYGGRHAGQEGS